MSVQNLSPGVKPIEWAVDTSHVASDYREWLHRTEIAIPFWSRAGDGDDFVNLGIGAKPTLADAAGAGTFAWRNDETPGGTLHHSGDETADRVELNVDISSWSSIYFGALVSLESFGSVDILLSIQHHGEFDFLLGTLATEWIWWGLDNITDPKITVDHDSLTGFHLMEGWLGADGYMELRRDGEIIGSSAGNTFDFAGVGGTGLLYFRETTTAPASNSWQGSLAVAYLSQYRPPGNTLVVDPFAPFRPVQPVVGLVPAVAAGRIMSSLAGSGGLAGRGGIAGPGGGLAA